jgi:solute:Na+ symporter, SSS family
MIWTYMIVVLYFCVIAFLGWKGYQGTKNELDFMVAGRSVHPYVMAMSYGATFISTSAIVGFGGAAGVFGMGLLWLTFLNIFAGIFLAFVVFGGRTRRMGHHLDAHTFPELMALRYRSRFIQGFSGLIIFLFMPLYTSVVIIGAAKFISAQFGIDYEVALFGFSTLVAIYVIMGGLKGVMYTDAFQGSIMLLGMIVLCVFAYSKLGGFSSAHRALGELTPVAVKIFGKAGHQGWTAFPSFGSPFWWTLVSTIIMGVGIGVLAMPQLVVRFMTVRSKRELNRAVLVGGIFILAMTGVAFVVGSLSNVYFARNVDGLDFAVVTTTTIGEDGVPVAQAGPPILKDLAPAPDPEKGIAVETTKTGSVSLLAAGKDVEQIIPSYVKHAMPKWFGVLFLLTLLAAAMSTISSQFHAMGTSIGRDFYEKGLRGGKHAVSSIGVTRLGILIGIVLSVFLGYWLEQTYGKTGTEIIARGTAIFFGLCASTFLSMYFGGLFTRKITKTGAISGMLVGFFASAFWLLFMHIKESSTLLLCNALFGKPSLVAGAQTGFIIWEEVDPLFIAFPLAILVTVVVSALTRSLPKEHLDYCFQEINN